MDFNITKLSLGNSLLLAVQIIIKTATKIHIIN